MTILSLNNKKPMQWQEADFADEFLTTRPTERYDASDIEVLEGLDPVRTHPGMYIGGTDDRALHHLCAEVLDNAMDEVLAGFATRIDISFNEDMSLTICDNGRGIPVDIHPKFSDKTALEVIFTTLHSGGKFSEGAYQTSGGLHGVGISVVNALSSYLLVEVCRSKKLYRQEYRQGTPVSGLHEMEGVHNRRGTSITFLPDPEIFESEVRFRPEAVYRLARSKAYLNSGVRIHWKCKVESGTIPLEATFHFPNGLADSLDERLGNSDLYFDSHFSGKVDFSERFGDETIGSVEWAINWTPVRDGFSRSYCNTIHTPRGGAHESGFWSAILKGIRAYGEFLSNRTVASVTREDLQSGGCALIACLLPNPKFAGQTKERLLSTTAHRLVENSVRDHFDNWLARDPKSASNLISYLTGLAEARIRKRDARLTRRKSHVQKLRLPGKLVDCSQSGKSDTELFLVEGDSAGGSAKMARDRQTQALLPLRGKVLNVLGASSSKLSGNAEINDMCLALGVGMGKDFKTDDLRYDRVIIMTDADVDGAHIATLLMTFFYTHMRPLIDEGHLYLACPPLYRLRQGNRRIYALNDDEMVVYQEKGLGGRGRIEVSRFKGLGEMDAKDLKQTTMNPLTRTLIRVSVSENERDKTDVLINRLMGKKPAERFRFLQERARFATNLDI